MSAGKIRPGSSHNPRAVRRAYQLTAVGPDRIYHYSCGSFTRPGPEVRHHQEISAYDRLVSCTCEAFRFGHRGHDVTLDTPLFHCKHIGDVIEILTAEGILDPDLNFTEVGAHPNAPERAVYILAKVNDPRVDQMFVYSSAADVPLVMQVLGVEQAVDPAAAVTGWLQRHNMPAGDIECREEVLPSGRAAWEVYRRRFE